MAKKRKSEKRGPILFPRFIGKAQWRTYALFAHSRLILETGQAWEVFEASELAQLLFEQNALTLVHSLLDLPGDWLDVAIAHGDCYCTPDGEPRALKLRGPRGTTRWVIQSSAWGQAFPTLELLEQLAEVSRRAQVGTPTTPGAFGLALLKRSFAEQFGDQWPAHRHRRPPEGICEWMRATCTGARNDLDPRVSDHTISHLKEIDLKNAYGASFARGVPCGHTSGFSRGDVAGYATYYAACRCTLTQPLSYGLFPVRTATTGPAQIIYPTQPGEYPCHLWREEVEFLRARGILVEVGDGVGWWELTTDAARFVSNLETLRDHAPAELKPFFKLALVAAIGRLGMGAVSYLLTDEETPVRVSFDGRAFDLFVETTVNASPESMPHWFYHVLMQCRLALTIEAERWKHAEMWLGENTDAVYLKGEADTSGYTPVEEKASVPSGTWVVESYHDVDLPAVRHFASEKKTTLPGIPREARAAYLQQIRARRAPP